tara:strand:- start:7600 stop:8190 length:591 start_codon:yes stop_codon:yes gene_type:complete
MSNHGSWNRVDGDNTLRLNYDILPSDVVLDAGGFRGDFASRIYDLYKPSIHVFEPVFEFCEGIDARFKDNPKVHANNYGLGSETKSQKFNISGDESKATDEGSVEVSIRDIKKVLEDLGNPTVALFKINIEGGEYDLLDRLIDTGLVSSINNLQIQFHDWHPNALERRTSIISKLEETHVCKYSYPFIWEGWEIKC